MNFIITKEEFAIIVRSTLDFLNIIFDNFFNFLLFITIIISLSYLLIAIYTLSTNKKKNKIKYKFEEKKAPFVTIQIPTYNELAAIQCAKKCLDMDYPKDKYEIIIGDDSKDKSISQKLMYLQNQKT